MELAFAVPCGISLRRNRNTLGTLQRPLPPNMRTIECTRSHHQKLLSIMKGHYHKRYTHIKAPMVSFLALGRGRKTLGVGQMKDSRKARALVQILGHARGVEVQGLCCRLWLARVAESWVKMSGEGQERRRTS